LRHNANYISLEDLKLILVREPNNQG